MTDQPKQPNAASPEDNASQPAAPTSPCPTCKKPVAENDATHPFCSPRCRQADLGKWLSGDYVVSRPLNQSDFDED